MLRQTITPIVAGVSVALYGSRHLTHPNWAFNVIMVPGHLGMSINQQFLLSWGPTDNQKQ